MTKILVNKIQNDGYASSRDKALLASKQKFGRLFYGLDTIDATSVDTSFIGHSHYAEAKSIVADLFEILKYQRAANERLNLAPTSTGNGNIWVFEEAAKVLQTEPPDGTLGPGVIRYIDDGSCGKAMIKKIVEGDPSKLSPRSKSCVPR